MLKYNIIYNLDTFCRIVLDFETMKISIDNINTKPKCNINLFTVTNINIIIEMYELEQCLSVLF